jgi:hypothetical protein
MSGKRTAALVLIGRVAWQVACSTGPEHDCTKHLKEEIYPGVRQGERGSQPQEAWFQNSHRHCEEDLVRRQASRGWLVFERAQVVINLDSDNRCSRSPLPPDAPGHGVSRVRCDFIVHSVVELSPTPDPNPQSNLPHPQSQPTAESTPA